MKTEIIEIKVPEYNIKEKPDYVKIGKKVDKILEQEFSDGKYILRAIGADDHPNLTVDELVSTIIQAGTDKYDPNRKAICHDEFSGYDYDIQAGTFEIKNSKIIIPKSYKYKTEFGDIIWHFYEHAPFDRGYSVRIDLLLIFDINQFKKQENSVLNQKELGKD